MSAFTSNQINVATYTVSYLSRRVAGDLDWNTIWRNQELTGEMRTVIKAWARKVAQHIESVSQGRLASEVSKKEGLFEDLCRALVDLPMPQDATGVPVDPVEMRGRIEGVEELDEDDERNIREVMSYTPERFLELRLTAAGSGDVIGEYHLGVIEKLDQLSRSGWAEKPTGRQAKMFLNALAKLESYGRIETAA